MTRRAGVRELHRPLHVARFGCPKGARTAVKRAESERNDPLAAMMGRQAGGRTRQKVLQTETPRRQQVGHHDGDGSRQFLGTARKVIRLEATRAFLLLFLSLLLIRDAPVAAWGNLNLLHFGSSRWGTGQSAATKSRKACVCIAIRRQLGSSLESTESVSSRPRFTALQYASQRHNHHSRWLHLGEGKLL